jgi:hypothetical protein
MPTDGEFPIAMLDYRKGNRFDRLMFKLEEE